MEKKMMMKQKNSGWNLGVALSLVAVLGLSAPVAQAAVGIPEPVITTSTVDSVSQPGSQALPSFVFVFGADYDLAGFDITINFDPAKLTFNAAASTLTTSAGTSTLAQVANGLINGPGNFLFSPDPDFGTAIDTGTFKFGGSFFDPNFFLPVSNGSSFTLTGVFNMRTTFTSGTTDVQVVGTAGDFAFNPFEDFGGTATVTAVPEPETWLMLLGGLGLIASRVRRRAKAQ
jgi:hypothetical protein